MGAFLPTPAPPRCRGGRQCLHGKPARRCCGCGHRQLSTSQRQHNVGSPALPPPASQHISLTVRFGEIRDKRRASGAEQQWDPWLPLALSQHPPVRSVVLWGAGRTGGLQGTQGGGRAPLPRAVPLVPAARAPLGRLCTTHPAAGLVGGQSLHHVQAVGLCPPAAGREGVRLLTGSCRQAASCPCCTLPLRGHPQPVPQTPLSSQC